jgi:predicted nucleic acid-binding protein
LVLVDTNVLATYLRNRALPPGKRRDLLVDAETRLPALRNVSHAEALETATEFGISAYDASLIALAKELRVKLVTEDAKLLAAVHSLTCSRAVAIG